jgi:hypothetical protein
MIWKNSFIYTLILVIIILSLNTVGVAAQDSNYCIKVDEGDCSYSDNYVTVDVEGVNIPGTSEYRLFFNMSTQSASTSSQIDISIGDESETISFGPNSEYSTTIVENYSFGYNLPTVRMEGDSTSRVVPLSPIVIDDFSASDRPIFDDGDSGEVDDGGSDNSVSVVVDRNLNYISQNEIPPTRYVDGDGEDDYLEDRAIPPYRDNASGRIIDFPSVKDTDGTTPMLAVNSTGDGIYIGFSFYNVPEADYRDISIKYALHRLGPDTAEADIELVNKFGERLPGSEIRTLDETENETSINDLFNLTDTDSLTTDPSVMNINEVEFEMNEETRQFINTNQEFYVKVETQNTGILYLYDFSSESRQG